jgi:sugar O-acyltransferase (sialic acid O-acetyltransferase NeuD family)
VAGFLDPALETGTLIDGIPIIGDDERLANATFVASHEYCIGVGDSVIRCKLARSVLDAGGTLPVIVHKNAVVAPHVIIGQGCVLMAGAIVNPGTTLEDFVIVNTAATVDHDCHIGEGTHLCPGSHLGGNVHCAPRVHVGIGASVVHGVRIGENAVVGAGSAVIRDVDAEEKVVGCPARPLAKGRD